MRRIELLRTHGYFRRGQCLSGVELEGGTMRRQRDVLRDIDGAKSLRRGPPLVESPHGSVARRTQAVRSRRVHTKEDSSGTLPVLRRRARIDVAQPHKMRGEPRCYPCRNGEDKCRLGIVPYRHYRDFVAAEEGDAQPCIVGLERSSLIQPCDRSQVFAIDIFLTP